MGDLRFDVLIIGAGQGAIPLSRDLAEAGRTVAVAERKHLGGSCVNFGCTPSKAVIASARLAQQIRRAGEYGLRVEKPDVDFHAVMDRARRLARESRESLEVGFGGPSKPTLLRGHARLRARVGTEYRASVGDDSVIAKIVVLDTGTRAKLPDIPGLRQIDCVTADSWIAGLELPSEMLLLGGGIAGLEFAQFYQRMGSKVTVIEAANQIAGKEDEGVARAIQEALESEGVRFVLGKKVIEVALGPEIVLEGGQRLKGTDLFVATGRRPNTDDLGLETVGAALDEHGYVKVDEQLHAGADSIFAIGDIRGGQQSTHASWDDYRILKAQLLGDGSRTTKRVLPYAIFTDPQLGRAGITEREAQQSGKPYKVGTYEVKHNGQAQESGFETGFVKVIVDPQTHRLLGAAILAAQAADMIQPCVDMMNADTPYTVFRDSPVVHPTWMEAVQSAFEQV